MSPGVIGGDVEVAFVGQVLVQVLPEHLRAHPGVVAFAEHVAMGILAGRVVGVRQGAEVKQPPFLGTLAGGNRDGTRCTAEQHRSAFVGQLVDVGYGLFRS